MMNYDKSVLPAIPPRDPAGHKGTFGTVVVIGGQAGAEPMIGGPALTAIAALRSGAGLVRLVCPAPILGAAIGIAPSATGVSLPADEHGAVIPHGAAATFDRILDRCAVIAIGPGLGVSAGAQALTLRAAGQSNIPVVFDADALNTLALTPQLQRDFHAPAILTPHPGEFARLGASLGIRTDSADPESRPQAAEALAQRLGCVVVLKGARTVVSDGCRTWMSEVADSALSTAGTGDVLTGLLAGLVAQCTHAPFSAALPVGSSAEQSPQRPNTREPAYGLSLYDCARIGVSAHALAAESWRTTARADAGLLAMELADHLPSALQRFRPTK